MRTVIKVENISKQYRLGQIGTGTIRHDINRWWYKVRGKEDPYLKIGEQNNRTIRGNSEYVWALQDISFEVKQGEVLGIIGRNGAGKSTLLKILSRTTAPTTGTVKIKGRVASLLEVGTGFHPDLTGRENIFLNGALLGMTKSEIKRKFDEIVDFAGVERYIDTPVKRYSSGMYVRLAFGVAAHLEPEILIVDEVLAVGDVEFQKKALGKMQDVSNKDGRTVLFVSHNMASLRSLCSRGILMIDGMQAYDGDMNAVINEYEKKYMKALTAEWKNTGDSEQALYLEKVRILDSAFQLRNNYASTEEVYIEMTIVVKEATAYIKVGFDLVKNDEVVFRSQQIDTLDYSFFEKGRYRLIGKIPSKFLNEGEYAVVPLFSIHCVKGLLDENDKVVAFKVSMDTAISDFHSILGANNHPGTVYPFLNWSISKSDV